MKMLIIAGMTALILSGFGLSKWVFGNWEVLVWIHLIIGFLFAVAFILYSIDHIGEIKKADQWVTTKNITGFLQFIICIILLLTGFILYLYGSEAIQPWSSIHFWCTVALIATSISHLLFNKNPNR